MRDSPQQKDSAFPELSLAGRVALVTGAGRGIGQGIALCLAEAGADVAVAARTASEIEDTAAQIARLGRRALPVPTDVTDAAQVEALVQRALNHFGKIDIVVTSAGIIFMKPVAPLAEKTFMSEIIPGFEQGMTIAEWDGVMSVNLRGTYLVARAVAPHLISRRQGKVLIVSSTEATQAWAYHSAYASTKAALMMLTRVLAKEWARYGIIVNGIAPGFIPTAASAFSYKDERLKELQLRMIPLRRFGNTREVGLLAAYLASDAANYITGQTFFIDGGVSA